MPQKTLISNFNAVESNNALTFDKKTIAKIFKDFFSNLAESLLIKLPNAPNKYNIESVFQYYSKFIIEKPFHLSITSEEEVFKIIQNIDILKTAGIDNLSGKYLKEGAEILAKPLIEIFNLSVTSRDFPNACKVAKLKPIFKKGKKTDPSDYRPISLLPLISKVLERVVHDQTHDHTTLRLWKNIMWHSTGFNPRAFTFPYFYQRHPSSCELKFIFIC